MLPSTAGSEPSVTATSTHASRTRVLQFRPQRFALDVGAVKVARRVHGPLVAVATRLGVVRPPFFALRDDLGAEEEKGTVVDHEDGVWDVMNRKQGEGADGEECGRSEKGGEMGGEKEGEAELIVYEMDLLPGVAYSTLLPSRSRLRPTEDLIARRLIHSLAGFFAQSWVSKRLPAWRLRLVSGGVGSSLISRLEKLELGLPEIGLREIAGRVLMRVREGGLERLPLVLTHGDLLPSNLLVEAESGRLLGVVDWAEAQVLPFGMALYGVERALGYFSRRKDVGEEEEEEVVEELEDEAVEPRTRPRVDSLYSDSGLSTTGQKDEKEEEVVYVYYEQAAKLRTCFYDRLFELIPELAGEDMRTAMALAKDVGVLLWHGLAWDDGKIDRVINEKDDPAELALLKALLAG